MVNMMAYSQDVLTILKSGCKMLSPYYVGGMKMKALEAKQPPPDPHSDQLKG